MRRLVLLMLAAGCAHEKQAAHEDRGAAAGASTLKVQEAMLAMQVAQRDADLYCAPWRTREIPTEEERLVGQERARALLRSVGPLAVEPGVTGGAKNERAKWLAVVGKNLARGSARPELQWSFGILESDTPGAFNTPGGYVFVTTGLLASLTNEAQLASVLAHEIVHVTSGHELARWRQAMHTMCITARTTRATMALTSGPRDTTLAATAEQFLPDGKLDFTRLPPDGFEAFVTNQATAMVAALGNDRADELATDAAAAHLVAFAGYDLAEFEGALRALPQPSRHPATADRVAALEALRKGELSAFTGKAKPDISQHTAALGVKK